MTKVLVTGGAGFVGSHLIDFLLEKGFEVSCFDFAPIEKAQNLVSAKAHSNFRYIQGDMRDKSALEKVFAQKFDTVYHLASIVGVHKYMDDPFGLIDITVIGTRNVAELAQKNATKIVYTSTSEVFGKNPKVPWDENDDRVLGSTQVDRWCYSSSKAVCEHMLLGLYKATKHPVTIVRYFNAYGPRQSPIFLVSQSVHRVLNNQRPLLYDGGQQTRCLTYIDDAVKGTFAAATNEKGYGEAFNIGNNREVTVKEVVDLVIQHSGTSLISENFSTEKAYGKVYEDVPRRVPAVEKAKRLLNWQVEVSHTDGIRKTIEWARKNEWWLKLTPTGPKQ